jgi:hypothetical protein
MGRARTDSMQRIEPFASAAPPASQPDADAAGLAHLPTYVAWLTESELGALLNQTPVHGPASSEQYRQVAAAQSAKAEVMRRALRPAW